MTSMDCRVDCYRHVGLIAIFQNEDDSFQYALRIERDEAPMLSAANLVEISLVLRGLKHIADEQAEAWLDAFVTSAGIGIEPVTAMQAELARIAHRQFGKGGGHGACLNYGDCFAYALAKALKAPLLFKGNDFSRTDLVNAFSARTEPR